MKKKIILIAAFTLLMVTVFLIFPFADSTTIIKEDVKNLYLNQLQIDGQTDIYYGNNEVLEVQFAGTTVWRAGSEITFNLDSGNKETVYYDYGKSIFDNAPKPQKEGWEFVGWSSNDEASIDDIITEYAADSTDFEVYAVFKKKITVQFYNNSTTPTVLTDYAYYNNGNIDNPEFTLQPVKREGWTLQGISTKITGKDVSNTYDNITIDSDTTYYSIYTKPLNFTFNPINSENASVVKNYEVFYYSTDYNHNGIKLCTAEEVDAKSVAEETACVWKEVTSGNIYNFGIDCPSEFYSSNVSDYTFDLQEHTPGEVVKENEVPSTCSENGHYDNVVYCEVCNKELSRETQTLPLKDHTPTHDTNYNNNYTQLYDTQTCTECGDKETVTVNRIGYMYDKWEWWSVESGWNRLDNNRYYRIPENGKYMVVGYRNGGNGGDNGYGSQGCSFFVYINGRQQPYDYNITPYTPKHYVTYDLKAGDVLSIDTFSRSGKGVFIYEFAIFKVE